MGSVNDAEYAFYASEVGNLGSINDVKAAFFAKYPNGLLPKTGRNVTIDDLPTSGVVSAHRGSGINLQVGPENSLTAYRTAYTLGCHILDVDYFQAMDGSLIAMHDSTVDRTTDSVGNVSDLSSLTLPNVYQPKAVGTGYLAEKVPTLNDIIDEFGGKVLLTIEVKGGLPGVAPLAALIKSRGLERSIYINAPATSLTVIQAITNAGCMPHVYQVDTSQKLADVKLAGAKLIEIAYNSSPAFVAECLASGIHRVIAGPLGTRAAVAAMTPGIQGWVTDSPGYTERSTPLHKSIAPLIKAQKRGVGWRMMMSQNDVSLYLKPEGLVTRNGADLCYICIGDLSGNPATTGSVTLKFKWETLPTTTSERVFARVLAPEENGTTSDADTRGYVFGMRATGEVNLWESAVGYGNGIPLIGGGVGTANAPVAGTEYTVLFEWTATQVRVTRLDNGATSNWVNSTAWRGPYVYLGNTMTAGKAVVTDISRTG